MSKGEDRYLVSKIYNCKSCTQGSERGSSHQFNRTVTSKFKTWKQVRQDTYSATKKQQILHSYEKLMQNRNCQLNKRTGS
jgi:hypothetical protein